MLQSHIIDVDGRVVGIAVRLDLGYRFIATDIRLEQLDASLWPTLEDVQRVAVDSIQPRPSVALQVFGRQP
jgi:hypothetical protein